MSHFSRKLIVILGLLFLINSLHLHDASQNYVEYLQNNQRNIKSKLESISKKIQQNYNSVSLQKDIDSKIELLEKYLKEQRLLLAELNFQTANNQLNQSDWVCPALSDSTKKQLNDDMADINKDLKDLNSVLIPLSDSKTGPGTDNAKEQIKDAEKTNQDLKNALNSKGQQIQPSNIHPDIKTNLNAPAWVLDGKKIDQLNDQYKKAAESGDLQICSINEPFFSTKQNKCIKCDGNNKYFSLRTSECLVCYNFDSKEHRCKDNEGTKTNYPEVQDRLIVPVGKNLDDYKNKDPSSGLACPQNAPFYTGSQCIECQVYFDLQTRQCKKCDGKNHYDLKTHTCQMEEITVSNIDAGKEALIIPNQKTLNDIAKDNKKLQDDHTVHTCPTDKPYYNDYQCIACAKGTFFSLIQQSCGTCQSGTFFNKATNHCQKKSYYTNLEDPNWSSVKPYNEVQKDITQKSKDPLFEKCPVQKPFSTGKQCIQCGGEEHFDYDKQKCDKCYNGQYFTKNLHNCSYTQSNYQTNPEKAPNLIYQGRPKNEWMYNYYKNIEKNQGLSDCPSQKPYFDGISCIICPDEHPYFNLEYKMCQKCNQGTSYDKDHHECLTTSGNIASQVPTLEKMAAGIFA